MAIDQILEERGERYGKFVDHARITWNLKRAMAASPRWETMDDIQREALEMIQHKVGRILNGDPNYADSWNDIAGYAVLVERHLNGDGV